MSKNKNKYDKTLDEYIEISKGDITLYIIIASIVTIAHVCIIIFNELYELFPCFFLGLLTLCSWLRVIEKIQVKNNLIIMKKYLIDNNLLEKIGKIEFYNDQDYFLTEKYMIIYRNKVVDCFEYNEINNIQKEYKYSIGSNSKSQAYLHIVLKDGRTYKILIASTVIVNEDYKDIGDDLLKKNPNINIEEESLKIKWKIFKYK